MPTFRSRYWFAGVPGSLMVEHPSKATADDAPPQRAEMAGYLLVPHGKVDAKYNAGFSMYVAAWPLLKNYPGSQFQSGLFGTWMFDQLDGPKRILLTRSHHAWRTPTRARHLTAVVRYTAALGKPQIDALTQRHCGEWLEKPTSEQ